MQARIKNPAATVPDALQPLIKLGKIVTSGPIPAKTLELVHLRVSQINGCACCIEMHIAKGQDETPLRLAMVAVWRDAPFFTPAERAALALAESVTKIADVADRVPDDVWAEAAQHYDEQALAMLVMHIGMVNFYNRLNVATRQVPGQKTW